MEHTIKNAEILCVGTELLLGDIVNTNAAFLSEKLAELGINVYRHTVVGDNADRLMSALATAFENADLVITSGGLGPTYDDMTKETVARFFGRTMELHEPSLAKIKEYFNRSGRIMTKNNEKQAMMPVGAIVFENNYGTAPALAIEDSTAGKTAIMLPGPPNELCPIFREKAVPYLKERSQSVIISKNIHFFGIGESALEAKMGDIMERSKNPSVAPYCKEGEVRLRVTAKADTQKQAEEMCDILIEEIQNTEVSEFIYGIDVETLENAALLKLRQEKRTLAVAESCTGGLVARRITDIPGCSDVFLGGCVTYTNEVKMKLLGVSAETLDRYSAVSKETALEMARGVRTATGADIGISTTGIAGPGGGTEETPVGRVFVAISTPEGDDVRMLSLSSMKSREYIRQVSASNAFDMILKH